MSDNGMVATTTTLLMVDDDAALLESATELLAMHGFQVLNAADGEQGLAVLTHSTPDVIISDIMMPRMDGYEFCVAVRANPEWATIPFIFLTALGQPEIIRKGALLGVDAHLVKPFEAEDLLVAVAGRLKRTQEIRAATDASVEQVKHRLMTVFGHEVRTPLNQIYGYVHLLKDEREQYDEETVGMMLGAVQRGAERLTGLVEDIIQMTNIESGLAALEAAHYAVVSPIEPSVKDVTDAVRPLAEGRNLTLETTLASGLEVCCVPSHLRDMVRRIVDNAIKFSKPEGGKVTINAGLEGQSVIISVQDEGIGISPDKTRRLFGTFEQIDRERMEQQGAGLGLAIARGLARIQGGDITVQSEPGMGSTFTISLPAVGQ